MEERLSPFFEQLDGVYRQGFPEAVEAFLRESLCRAEAETDRELELAVRNELGSFFRGAGRYEESLSAFRRAEFLAGELRGRGSGAYATVLNNMAGTCRLLHRASEAESLFLRAMECYRQAGLEDSDAYTSVLNNLSLVYRETGELGKAIDYLLRALKRLEGRGDRQAELAVTYNNLTTLYQAAGDRDKALLCVNRALQEYEKCPEEQRVHYAAVLNSLAGFLCGQGDLRRRWRCTGSPPSIPAGFSVRMRNTGSPVRTCAGSMSGWGTGRVRWLCWSGQRRSTPACLERRATAPERWPRICGRLRAGGGPVERPRHWPGLTGSARLPASRRGCRRRWSGGGGPGGRGVRVLRL